MPIIESSAVAEFLISYIASKAMDSAIKNRHVFFDRTTGWFNFFRTANNLHLTENELYEAYTTESPVTVEIGQSAWVFPARQEIAPQGKGEIAEQDVQFRIEKAFSLDPAIHSDTETLRSKLLKSKKFHEGAPWRINKITKSKGKKLISISPASYFDVLCTNFAMDYDIPGRGKTIRKTYNSGAKLDEFRHSKLVNPMGVACIILTADQKLIFQHRSKNVAVYPNTLSASASGTVEGADFAPHLVGTTVGFSKIEDAMRRETFFELHTPLDKVVFLGLYRDFLRGGLPDFYFLAYTSLTFKQVMKNHEIALERYETDKLDCIHYCFEDACSDSRVRRNNFESEAEKALYALARRRGTLTLMLGMALATQHLLDDR